MKIQSDLERYGREILDSEEMRQAFHQRHHLRSTLGEHSQRVARRSLIICYILNKLHISTDIQAVVVSSLCHDLGILGRKKKYHSIRECYRKHPIDSVEVARKLMKELPEKVPDIIERHMWPGCSSKAPNSLEGIIVSAADKSASVADLIWGRKNRGD